MDELVIRIKPDTSVILEEKKKGIISRKSITISDLAECIQGSISAGIYSSGILPKNCVSYTYDTGKGNHYIVLEYPENHADITYMKTLYENFHIPKLVFGFIIKDEKIEKVNMGVTANERLKDDTQMYVYPFSNVSKFYLCTGANSLPKIKSFVSLSNLPRFILSLPDNDDHYRESNNKLGLGHRELLEHLTDKTQDYYYEKVLIPMARITLKDFLKSD